jgi:addiction module RelE/StbE family toxin
MRQKLYRIVFTRTATKDYESIRDKKLLKRINIILEDLKSDPLLGKPLHGDFADCRSIKTFSFRLIYRIEKHDVVIAVLRIQHRRESYR